VKTWKLTLEYDGSKYSGWQEQRNAPKTVQGALREAAERVFESEVDLGGSGRTDSGVHALGQVAHLRGQPPRRVTDAQIMKDLNELLPADIAVLDIRPASARFHARHDALSRTYLYQITTRKSAFSKRSAWWVKERLDTAAMALAARRLAGRHDFRHFRAADPARPDESTLVVVESALVETVDARIEVRITASHFLWRMVRRVTGALVQIGMGSLRMDQFDKLLSASPQIRLPVSEWTAPAAGLYLESVRYPPGLF
jgi:tRNA pseudouridine38-40 synthase